MPETSPIKHIGYAGLGIMGRPMAENLLAAGYRLTVWNRTASKAQPLLEKGAEPARSLTDLAAQGPDVICLNVTDTPDVEAVLFGDEDRAGLTEQIERGRIIIDHSTISPVQTRGFAERLTEQGVTLIDAPVSGGDAGARNGSLSIMVGGPGEQVERVRPVLEVNAGQVTHVGRTGDGQTCKACNQIAVGVNLLGVCEAIGLARSAGLDPRKMVEVVSSGAGGSWQMQNLGPKVLDQDYDPGFMVDYILKDLKLVAETARAEQRPLTATPLAEALFRSVSAHGGGKLGTQALAKAVEGLAGE